MTYGSGRPSAEGWVIAHSSWLIADSRDCFVVVLRKDDPTLLGVILSTAKNLYCYPDLCHQAVVRASFGTDMG
ncbi:MAG: hypothetical protein NTZ04_03000 [Chloroflexi bacterium]|nr:hypothetical protein [Chloroflexota bacterium]